MNGMVPQDAVQDCRAKSMYVFEGFQLPDGMYIVSVFFDQLTLPIWHLNIYLLSARSTTRKDQAVLSSIRLSSEP